MAEKFEEKIIPENAYSFLGENGRIGVVGKRIFCPRAVGEWIIIAAPVRDGGFMTIRSISSAGSREECEAMLKQVAKLTHE